MKCYKCGIQENLSIKRRLKSGHTLLICKSCRKIMQAEYNERRTFRAPTEVRYAWETDWNKQAKETVARISRRFA